MLNFDFLESVGKCLGIDSLPHDDYSFQEKCFLCYVLLTDQFICLIAFTSSSILHCALQLLAS